MPQNLIIAAFSLRRTALKLYVTKAFTPKSSSRYDGLSMTMIKPVINLISCPLAYIFNSMTQTGIFPDSLKIAKVIPIHKSDSKLDIKNYRPISLLPTVSKIFEKLLYNGIYNFLVSHNLLCEQQYGFRKKCSTLLALLDMHNDISKSFDNKALSLGIFLDLSKAFDVINHDILLQKLSYYGICGLPLMLIESYLSNRKQFVRINGVDSSMSNVICGVPQGSILGPLFFIVFINDVVYCSNILQFILYADDTNVFLTTTDITAAVNIVNVELEKLSKWFKANRLMLNASKSCFIIFKNNKSSALNINDNMCIKIDNTALKQVNNTKFLGVVIDSNLSWSYHIDYVAMTLSRVAGVLNRVKFVLPQSALMKIYYSLFYSNLLYCLLIWGNADSKFINRVQILQNRALRAVSKASYRSSTNPLYIKLKCLKLNELYSYHLAIFFFKLYNGYLPIVCNKYMITSSGSNTYNLRAHTVHNLAKTACRQRHIMTTGPILWDSIPSNIKNVKNLSTFKTKVFIWLHSKYN